MFSLCLFILAISYQSMLTLKPAWLTHTCSWIGFHSPAWRVTFMTPHLTKDVVCFCFVFVSEFSKGSFVPRLLIFVLKCILFFILHDTVINYIYRKDCDYCGCPHAPHFGTVDYCEWGGVTTFASNLARKFYSNVFFYWETIVLWLCVQVRPKCVWACACMCLYKRRRGCMVCYDSPDGLRLPVPGYDE